MNLSKINKRSFLSLAVMMVLATHLDTFVAVKNEKEEKKNIHC